MLISSQYVTTLLGDSDTIIAAGNETDSYLNETSTSLNELDQDYEVISCF